MPYLVDKRGVAIINKRITIRDIASRLGLAHSTVSCALRGSGRVAAETRERVLNLAAELGYRPDPALAALNAYRDRQRRSARPSCLALIHGLSRLHRFAQAFLRAAADQAERHGYLPTCIASDGDLAASLAQAREQGACACIFTFNDQAHWNCPPILLEGLATVFVGHNHPGPCHRVTSDDAGSMRMVLNELRLRGYRRIGLALGRSTDANSDRLWSTTYLGELVRAEQELSPLPIFNEDGGGFTDWLAEQRPDVVISRRSYRQTLSRAGHRIPETIGYVNLGVPDWRAVTSGTINDPQRLATAAVSLCDLCLRRHDLGIGHEPLTICIPPRWHEGNSLRPRQVAEEDRPETTA